MIELTEKQQLFVDSFLGEAEFNITKAGTIAGCPTRQAAHEMYKSRGVQSALKETFQSKVLKRLWKEATNTEKGSTHQGRITALVHLGKHVGMFQEKKEQNTEHTGAKQVTYNIVNYDSSPKKLENNKPDIPVIPEEIKEEEE
jgi:hypothetical protein